MSIKSLTFEGGWRDKEDFAYVYCNCNNNDSKPKAMAKENTRPFFYFSFFESKEKLITRLHIVI